MAHRLPAAGVPTEISEHFANYHVIPKPEVRCRRVAPIFSGCQLRPRFVCPSQSTLELMCPPKECARPLCCRPCPVKVTQCCQPKASTCWTCCAPRPEKLFSCGTPDPPTCCTVRPNPCWYGEDAYVIKLTVPKINTDHIKHTLRKTVDRLKDDLIRTDNALCCLEKEPRSNPIQVAVKEKSTGRLCCKPLWSPLKFVGGCSGA